MGSFKPKISMNPHILKEGEDGEKVSARSYVYTRGCGGA